MNQILNYLCVSDTISSSGQPKSEDFSKIHNAGFQLVINLAMPSSDKLFAKEAQIILDLGMFYFRIAVPFDNPKPMHLRSFFSLMRLFEGKKCWIHCSKNYRVSAFLYQYFRLVLGYNKEKCSHVLLDSWLPNEIWSRYMQLEIQDIGV